MNERPADAVLMDCGAFARLSGFVGTSDVASRFANGYIIVAGPNDPARYAATVEDAAKMLRVALREAVEAREGIGAPGGNAVYEILLDDREREREVREALIEAGIERGPGVPPDEGERPTTH